MTNNFSLASHMLASGYYELFKGDMDDTSEVVAVERALGYNVRTLNEFTVQLEVLPRLHHSNVVRYAGFCTARGERVLVFEYMPNGSLFDCLFGDASRKEKLTWPIRRNICLGVAEGIRYLHSLSQPRIVHRDIKAGNILLDQNLEPKLGGFGLVHMLAGDGLDKEELDWIVGTSAYIAPEYISHGKISQTIDVYSFGVVLLEIVCGRRGFDPSLLKAGEEYIVNWTLKMHSDGRCKSLIDCSLDLQADEEMEAVRIIQIAIMCVDYLPERRPDMRLVVAMLQGDLDADISCIESILEDWRERRDKFISLKTSDSIEVSPSSSVSNIGSSSGDRFEV